MSEEPCDNLFDPADLFCGVTILDWYDGPKCFSAFNPATQHHHYWHWGDYIYDDDKNVVGELFIGTRVAPSLLEAPITEKSRIRNVPVREIFKTTNYPYILKINYPDDRVLTLRTSLESIEPFLPIGDLKLARGDAEYLDRFFDESE